MNSPYFIIGDGINTSYIDSLIVSLFYKPTYLDNILSQYPQDSKFIYLQELINTNVIDVIRKNFSVDKSIINEIRNYSIDCGWKYAGGITKLYNVIDYMTFLLSGFDLCKLQIEIIDITKTSNVSPMIINYIELKPDSDSNINTELSNWINKNIIYKKSNIYKFIEVPLLIPIYINRNQLILLKK